MFSFAARSSAAEFGSKKNRMSFLSSGSFSSEPCFAVRIGAMLSRKVDAELRVTVLRSEKPVAERIFRSTTGVFAVSIDLESVDLWSPDAPNLYEARVVLLVNGAPVDLFSGWMFASSPAVSALEHPVYDIWVIDCAEPVAPVAGAQGVPETTPPSSQ